MRVPAAVGNLQHTSSDWNEYAETQPGRACTKLIDGKSFWPRGKCLGAYTNLLLSTRYLRVLQGGHLP